jgi:hypothetical protein
MTKIINLVNKKVFRLLVLRYLYTKPNGSYWECLCDCGNICIKRGNTLKHNKEKSCGCYKKEYVANKNFKHGFSERNGINKVFYGAFLNAKRRCENPNNKRFYDYGGRGIKFLFSSFQEFKDELGPRPSPDHSVDRINNDGNYEKGNLRWSTRSEQQRNSRKNKYNASNQRRTTKLV